MGRIDDVLYIPFSSNTKASILRTCVLSMFAHKRVKVMYVLKREMSSLFIKLLKIANVKIFVLSKESYSYYQSLGIKQVSYIRTGVDINQFAPVNQKKKEELRQKYNINKDEKIVLHVGHLHHGRNVDKMMLFKDVAYPHLVVSSVSIHDEELRKSLEDNHVKIMDTYIAHIEEIYQISDVYFFPVVKQENCIDVPLSVLEAASCNLPIIATQYGELKSFKDEDGFIFLDSFDKNDLINHLNTALSIHNFNNRNAVLDYDWTNAINLIMQ